MVRASVAAAREPVAAGLAGGGRDGRDATQGGEAGLIQKLTSKEIPNLDKVPKDTLDRFAGFGASAPTRWTL